MSNRRVIEDEIMLNQLRDYGKIIVRWESTDCDGADAVRFSEHKNIDDFYENLDDAVSWADGAVSYTFFNPKNKDNGLQD